MLLRLISATIHELGVMSIDTKPYEGAGPEATNGTFEHALEQTLKREAAASEHAFASEHTFKDERLKKIAACIKENADYKIREEVQEELVELLNMLPELEHERHQSLIPLAEVAVAALIAEEPNLKLAFGIIEKIRTRLKVSLNPFINAFVRGSAPSQVIIGMGVILYLLVLSVMFIAMEFFVPEQFLGIELSLLVLVGISGAIGSTVSIMVRIHDFARLEGKDPSVLLFTGFFKAVIGTSFALFLFVTLNAGFLPVEIGAESANYFFASIGFISGFSERLAKDISLRTDGYGSGMGSGSYDR